MLVDPYQPGKKFTNFTDLDATLQAHYDHLLDFVPTADILLITPRYQLDRGLRIGYRDIFYYIDKLYDNDPGSVIDVGCGECTWKKWFPNIQGFDSDPSIYADHDFVDYFDRDFSQGHSENWECGLALNSIHFVPWSDITEQISLAMNLIRPGGRFLFTFNFDVIDNVSQQRDDYHSSDNKQIVELSLDDKVRYMDGLILGSGFKIILKDYPSLHGYTARQIKHISHINGHARVILEK